MAEKALPKHSPELSLENFVRVCLVGNIKGKKYLIFKEERRTEPETWNQIIQNIRETILAEKWYEEDWKTNPQEERIMKGLNLKPGMLNASLRKHHTPNGEYENYYKCP